MGKHFYSGSFCCSVVTLTISVRADLVISTVRREEHRNLKMIFNTASLTTVFNILYTFQNKIPDENCLERFKVKAQKPRDSM